MKIDIYQDTVCPWCRVGKQHLFQALENWDGDPVEIQWHAFLLDGTIPKEGKTFSDFMKKFGSRERVDQMHSHVCTAGIACGINFNFNKIQTMPNTLLSHQFIQMTPAHLRTEACDAIMRAYFEDGRDIGDVSVLLDAVSAIGVPRADLEDMLAKGVGLAEVQADLEFAQKVGISGVPFFIFDDKYALSGAQPIEVFTEVLRQIQSENK